MKTDWSDRFLARGWPFARTAPLPPIEVAVATARCRAAEVISGPTFEGRPTLLASRARLEEILDQAAMGGIVAAVEHYARVDGARRAISARVRRGLFRLWCSLSVVWIGFILTVAFVVHPPRDLADLQLGNVMLVAFVLPAAVLVVSTVVLRLGFWVWNGFRGGP